MIEFNLKAAEELLEMFGGDDARIVVDEDKEGRLYAWHVEYPEEGCMYLGETITCKKEAP